MTEWVHQTSVGTNPFSKIPFSFRAMLLQFYKNEKIKIQIQIKSNWFDSIKEFHLLKTEYWPQIYKKKYGAIGNSMLCYKILRDLCNCSFLTMVKSSFSSSSDKFGQSDWTLRTTFFIILSSRPWTTLRRCSSRIFSINEFITCFSRIFMLHFLRGCKVSFSVKLNSYRLINIGQLQILFNQTKTWHQIVCWFS